MERRLRVVHLEDDENDARLVSERLHASGTPLDLEVVQSEEALAAALDAGAFDLILSDYSGPGFDGGRALAIARSKAPETPFIFVSGTIGEDVAVESLRDGATDYVLKTGNMKRLVPAVERALREARERRERKRLEDQYRQAQKMEAVGRLAGGVAHDFNNLLTSILGLSQIAMEELQPQSRLRQDLEEIAQTAVRAAQLTGQLLAFSRKQVIEPRAVDLNDVIAKVQKMLRRVIGEDVALVFTPASGLGAIRIDPGQMEQVILNLAVNARDAMPDGGTLALETAEERSASGAFVVLRVRDTGVGMSDDVRARIFEPFFTTKEAGKGTGLGLATCYGIVSQSGGRIEVDSAPGRGAVFSLYFPRIDDAPEASAGRERLAIPEGSETVLIVEDEAAVRTLAARMLRGQGYEVVEAADADEAVARVRDDRDRRIRLAVVDMIMPKFSGATCADKIRAARPDVRILFMSGYADDMIGRLGLKPTAQVLVKPFSLETLAVRVRERLDEASL